MIRTYEEAKKYLEQFIPFIIDHRITPNSTDANDNLGRIQHLLMLLGNPHKRFPSVVVSGTSGKGSVSYLVARMLTEAGYKTGLTISPHLQCMTERVQLGLPERFLLSPISKRKFITLLNCIVPMIESMRTCSYGIPSYYEVLLGLAFYIFAKERVNIAVVEVGIEGRYDATNLVDPLIFVLNNISLDHTNILGDSVEKIADEATYRIKTLKRLRRKMPLVITGVTQSSVIKLINKRCDEAHIKLVRFNKDFNYRIKRETHEGVEFDYYQRNPFDVIKPKTFFVSLRGAYQAENASIAIQVVEKLKKFGFHISEKKIRDALLTATFPGRFEELELKSKNYKLKVILDGAHNPVKMASFLNAFEKIYPSQKRIFIIGFKRGKDTSAMLNSIIQCADLLIITKFTSISDWGINTGMDIKTLREQISSIKGVKPKIFYEKDMQKALEKAINLSSKTEWLIVITGSLYLVGENRQLLFDRYNVEAKF